MSEFPSRTRRLSPILALLAGLLGFGYVYVGRISYAIAFLISSLGVVAIFSWTRLVLQPGPLYVLALVSVAILLFVVIHAVVIAARNRRTAAEWYNRWWFYSLWFVACIGLGHLLLSTRAYVLGYEPFRTPSGSMSPTLEAGDLFMTDTWLYRNQEPMPGDIVVYRTDEGVSYVKRIVGVPGDTIEIRDAVVYRNASPTNEPYLHAPLQNIGYGRDVAPIELGPSEYYLLGDFRDNSRDSRISGPVDRERIRGRAEFIWFSAADGKVRWDRFPRYLNAP